MASQDEINNMAMAFVQQSSKKVMLIVGQIKDIIIQQLLQHLRGNKKLLFYFDLSQQIDIEATLESIPVDHSPVLIFSINCLENLYIKYQLDHWQSKVIVLCNDSLLHPTLDPSIYFAPIVDGRIQKSLFCKADLDKTISGPNLSLEGFPLGGSSVPKEGQRSVSDNLHYRSHFLNKKLLVNDSAIMQMLSDRVWVDEAFKDFLFQIIYASRHDAQFTIASSNAITILNYAKVPFSGLDLSNIKIPDADLSFGVFHNTNFFHGDLRRVKFFQAYLAGTNLGGCQIDDIDLGQLPVLEHEDSVNDACYSPDGHIIAVASGKNIILWDQDNSIVCGQFIGHVYNVNCLAFSVDGKILASGSLDGTIVLWDIINRSCRRRLVEYRLYSINTLVFNSNNTCLASGSNDNTIRLWNVNNSVSQVLELKGHTGNINVLVFSHNDQLLISGSNDKSIRFWSINTQTCLHEIELPHEVLSLALSPNGKTLVCSDEHALYLFDMKNGDNLRKIFAGNAGSQIAFNPKGNLLAFAGGHENYLIQFLDMESQNILEQSLEGHHDSITSLTFSPQDRWLISGSNDKTVRRWDVMKLQSSPMQRKETSKNVKFVICPKSDIVIAQFFEKTWRRWNLTSRQALDTVIEDSKKNISNLIISNEGNLLVGWQDKFIYVWWLKNKIQVINLELKDATDIKIVIVSPDEKFLAICYLTSKPSSYKVQLIGPNLREGFCSLLFEEEIHEIDQWISDASFRGDNRVFVINSMKSFRIWNIATQPLLLGSVKERSDENKNLNWDSEGILIHQNTRNFIITEIEILAPGSSRCVMQNKFLLRYPQNMVLIGEPLKEHVKDVYRLAIKDNYSLLINADTGMVTPMSLQNSNLKEERASWEEQFKKANVKSLLDHKVNVKKLLFKPCSKVLIDTMDKTLRLLSADTKQCIQIFRFLYFIKGCQLTYNEKFLFVVTTNDTVILERHDRSIEISQYNFIWRSSSYLVLDSIDLQGAKGLSGINKRLISQDNITASPGQSDEKKTTLKKMNIDNNLAVEARDLLAIWNSLFIYQQLSLPSIQANNKIAYQNAIGLHNLPPQIIINILRWLCAFELSRLMSTCRLFNTLANYPLLWLDLLKFELSISISELNNCSDHPKKIYAKYSVTTIYFSTAESIYKLIPKSRALLSIFNLPGQINKLLYIPPHQLIIFEGTSKFIHIYDLQKSNITKTFNLQTLGYPSIFSYFNINIIALNKNQLFISHSQYGGGGATAAAKLDLDSGELFILYQNQSDVSDYINLNPQAQLSDGRVAFRSCHPDMITIDNPSREISRDKDLYFGKIGTITAMEPINGHTIALGWEDGQINFVNTNTLKLTTNRVLDAGKNSVRHLVAIPNKKLVSGSEKGEIIIWDLVSESELSRTLIERKIISIKLKPYCLNQLIIATQCEILTWDWQSNDCECLFKTQGNEKITGLAVAPQVESSTAVSKEEKYFTKNRSSNIFFWKNVNIVAASPSVSSPTSLSNINIEQHTPDNKCSII